MPGADLAYFRFTGKDQRANDMFVAAYGAEPNQIKIVLPFPGIDQNLEAFREKYVKSRLVHRCDGVVIWERNAVGELAPTNKPCPTINLPDDSQEKCKPCGRLRVIIPALARFAYVTVLTTSKIDISRLAANMAAIQAIAGQLHGIPLILSRHPEEIAIEDGKGGHRRVTKHLLSLEIDPEFAERRLLAEASHAMIIASNPNALALPAPMPRLVDTSTGEILGQFADEHDDDEEDEELLNAIIGKFPDSRGGPDGYAEMDGYHPNMDAEEAEGEIEEEIQARQPAAKPETVKPVEPAPKPKASTKNSLPSEKYTAEQRKKFADRIRGLQARELEDGYPIPNDEMINLDKASGEALIALGQKIRARMEARAKG